MIKRLRMYLELVRFSHTLFALPFAVASAVWAAQGWMGWKQALLILLAMVTCRNTAMAFNRLVDARFDAQNPRTAMRHLPQGKLKAGEVLAFLTGNGIGFVVITAFINHLAFALSVPTLIAVCGYSFAKRFTRWSHVILGFAIGISPIGAWVAVTGRIELIPCLLALALMLWIAGFDIIYAAQDEDSDRQAGLHSLPVALGRNGAMRVAQLLHGLMFMTLLILAWVGEATWPYGLALSFTALALMYIHLWRKSDGLDSLNQDFFKANVAISLFLMLGVLGHVWAK